MNDYLINKHNISRFFYHLKKGDFVHIYKKIREKVFFNHNTKNIDITLLSDHQNYEKLIFDKCINIEVSIIIPIYNQFDYTYKCLKSIRNNTQFKNYEIIIADDSSNDKRIKNIKDYVDNIKIIRNKSNLGFLENCNNATKYAKGKYLLFLNNDTQVQEAWLEALVELIESNKKIGMVGSKLVYPDGRLQEAGGIIWKDASGWNFGRLDDPNKPEYNYVKEVDYISGASIMIRKELWDKIGGFDKRYKPAYFEDSDLAFEVRKHGYKVLYQPKSVVVHFEGVSHGIDEKSGVKKYQTINREKFKEKWKDVLKKEQFENGKNVFLARDRSQDKPCILFIDHYLPHYDRDAGSKAIFNCLKFFAKEHFNVKFIGDNFFHYPDTPYLTALNQIGIEVLWGTYYAKHWKNWLIENGQYIDYVLLSRPHIAIKYIDAIKNFTNAKILYYGHDLHFLRLKREYELTGNKKLRTMSNEFRILERELFDKSDVVYYLSDFEKEVIKEKFPGVKVKTLPIFIYEKFEKIPYNFDKRKDLMFVGGFDHSPNTDGVLWFVNEIFPLVLKKIPKIHFYIIGSNPPDKILKLNVHPNITVTGYVSDKELHSYYTSCKLAVVPLRIGAGVKGKIIEGIYKQIPIITTSIGAEGIKGIENIVTIADESEEFARKLVALYYNENLLKTISEQSFNYVVDNFSFKKMKEVFKEDVNFNKKRIIGI